jgi:hypothetical protein
MSATVEGKKNREREQERDDVDYTLYYSSLLLLCTCHKVDHTFRSHLRRIERSEGKKGRNRKDES